MAKNKTTETNDSVAAYLDAISDSKRKEDCTVITKLMQKISGMKPKMWGAAIVGYGSYHYEYDSGHSGDAPLIAFSSRANSIVLYLSSKFEHREELLGKLGKHKTGKACLYIKKLEDVNMPVLSEMITKSLAYTKDKLGQ